MKNFYKISLALLATVALAPAANAASATGSGKATILQPLTVTKGVDLDFGKIVAASTSATVELSATGTRTCNGGLTCLGTPAAGTFTVAGYTGQTVSVATSGTATLTGPGGASMSTTVVASVSSLTLAAGAGAFSVGGTLSVGANQAAGEYVGNYDVTVNYI